MEAVLSGGPARKTSSLCVARATALRAWQSPRPRESWSCRGCSECLLGFTGYAGFEDNRIFCRKVPVRARISGFAGFEDCQKNES